VSPHVHVFLAVGVLQGLGLQPEPTNLVPSTL
jgi:hypothetical protein